MRWAARKSLRVDLESAINLTIDFSTVMTATSSLASSTGVPPVQVDLPRDVLGTDDAVLHPKGTAALSTVQMPQIITTKSPTETGTIAAPQHRRSVGRHRRSGRCRAAGSDAERRGAHDVRRDWRPD